MFVKAAIALDAKKAMLKQAALEVVFELLAHKWRKVSTGGLEGGDEGWIVLLDELIEYRLFWLVTNITNGCTSRQG